MKFLNVKCEKRRAIVYINLEKISMLIASGDQDSANEMCLIEVEGLKDNMGPVLVNAPVEDVIRMINGEEKLRIGFRTGG